MSTRNKKLQLWINFYEKNNNKETIHDLYINNKTLFLKPLEYNDKIQLYNYLKENGHILKSSKIK